MRNSDNYQNAYQYITQQLFVYNYNIAIHVHLLKLKLWCLDGSLLPEEMLPDGTTPDKNVNQPIDHKASLDNELFFLELYRRTKDGLLEPREQPFDTVVANRIKMAERWITQEDPITHQLRKDYEMDYSVRPLLMSVAQIEQLYTAYKVKEQNGELQTCLEITTKVTEDNIDNKTVLQQMAVDNYIYPPESEQMMLEQAIKIKLAEDDDLVTEINKNKVKIANQVLKLTAQSNISPVPPAMQVPNPTVGTFAIVAGNIPQTRVNVIAQRHGPSSNRKGHIIDTDDGAHIHTGGYRYPPGPISSVGSPGGWDDNPVGNLQPGSRVVYRIGTLTLNYTTIPGTSDPDTGTSTPPTYIYNSYSIAPVDPDANGNYPTIVIPDPTPPGYFGMQPSIIFTNTSNINFLQYQIERNWDGLALATYVSYSTPGTSNPDGSSSPGSSTYSLLPVSITLNATRLTELKTRWKAFNEFREHKIDNTGTRSQLESMLDTDVPLILAKLQKMVADLKQEKISATRTLVEDCLFGEWA